MKVILPGSYDPVTLGHLEIIKRAAAAYDEVYAVAFVNPKKEYLFSPKEKVEMLALATAGLPNVKVGYSDGYVIDYMRSAGIGKIVKGYRNEADLEYEKIQADYNLKAGGYQTELWLADDKYKSISSTEARRLIHSGGDLSELLPESVIEYIKKNH